MSKLNNTLYWYIGISLILDADADRYSESGCVESDAFFSKEI